MDCKGYWPSWSAGLPLAEMWVISWPSSVSGAKLYPCRRFPLLLLTPVLTVPARYHWSSTFAILSVGRKGPYNGRQAHVMAIASSTVDQSNPLLRPTVEWIRAVRQNTGEEYVPGFEVWALLRYAIRIIHEMITLCTVSETFDQGTMGFGSLTIHRVKRLQ